MEKVRVYIGCGLTHAPEEYRQQIIQFKDRLRAIEWIEVLDFVTKNSTSELPDPLHIYHNDIHECVGTAHAMIADLSYPSTGLGWELGTCIEKHQIRVIMCAHRDAVVSHLPIGAALRHDTLASFDRYEKSISDLFDFCIKELQKIKKPL